MLLTTGSYFDGYRVKKYLDVFSKEVVYKNGLGKSLGAAVTNIIDSFTFKDYELTGSSELISNAKNYVFSQFIQEAEAKGANAILGIDFETSFGDSLFRLAISGTAVIVEKDSAEDPTAGKTTEIPVVCATASDLFCPLHITLCAAAHGNTLSLAMDQYSNSCVTAMEANVHIRNIFGDEVCIENACFLNIRQRGVHSYISDAFHVNLPDNILLCAKECSLEIKKYMKDDQVIECDGKSMVAIEEIKLAPAQTFDAEALLTALAPLKKSQEMIHYLESSDMDQSGELYQAIHQALKNRFQFERMYGTNTESTLKAVRAAIDACIEAY